MKNFLKPSNNAIPFVHVVKRQEIKWYKSITLYLFAIFLALMVGAIVISSVGVDPFPFYGKMLSGTFSNKIHFRGFIRMLTPLLITSLGIAVAFKMKYWNIGAEGQFVMGALMANTAANLLQDSLPSEVTLLIVLLSGVVGGGIYGLITAVLKVQWGTNETLLTLMFNYIAFFLVKYLKNEDFFRIVGKRPDFQRLPKSSWLNEVMIGSMKIDIGIFIAIALVFVVLLYLYYSKHGYEISIVGDSLNTAKYSGMNVKWIIIRTMFLSAAIIGLAGALQVTGPATNHTISENITSGVGWTGIIIAWLSKLNPIVILIVSFLMAILFKGSNVASSAFNTSPAVADVLQGVILFVVLAMDFFINYKLVFRTPPKEFFKKCYSTISTSLQNLKMKKASHKEEK